MTTKTTKSPKWEVKDRMYKLIRNQKCAWYQLRSVNSKNSPLRYFDEEAGITRALRYSTIGDSPFIDEQKGDVLIGPIIFLNGHLFVPKEEVTLQKFLSIYHPDNDRIYEELKPSEEAKSEVASMDEKIDALVKAREIPIDQAAAILRVEQGNGVDGKKSDEIRRDILVYADQNPIVFLDFVNDEDLMLKEVGIKAVNMGLVLLTDGNTIFKWKNGKKLFSVPFDELPYSALGRYFKTDEGVEVFKSINKKLAL